MTQVRPELRVVYDGSCGLCSRTVHFLYKNEKSARFTFTPIQSPCGQVLARRSGLDPLDPSSFAVISADGRTRLKSTAAFFALKHCKRPWPQVSWACGLLPRRLTDFAYSFIARRRLAYFGSADACSLAGRDLTSRLVERVESESV